jgi:2-methylcitrate dehydratase PrpD
MLAARFGRFTADVRLTSLPPEIVAAVQIRILDTLGAGLAGVQLGNHRAILQMLESGGGGARVWGEGITGTVREAALVNSFATHSTYLEDGSRFTGGHPSCVVIPAAIAEAEASHLSGAELIAAVAVGYEIFLRLGRAIYPATVVRGFQSTAVLGAVSAAAAVAHLRRMSAEASAHAIAIAASLGVGMKEALKSSASQPIQVARSCEGGIVAAMLAGGGLEGAPKIFEKGFLPAFGGEAETSSVTAALGTEYRIGETYLKRHAGCRGNHAPVDAALALREMHRIDPAQVRRVRAAVDTVTRAAAIEPPASGEQAQFSIGFSIAVALLDGNASIFQYTDARLADPAVRTLMDRITVEVEPRLDAGYPDKRAAEIEIELEDGRTLRHCVDNALGEPEWPLSAKEVEDKFFALAQPRLGGAAGAVRDMVANLPTLSDIATLTRLLVPKAIP